MQNANDIKFILIRLMLCNAVVLLKNRQKVVAGRLKDKPKVNRYKLVIVLKKQKTEFHKTRHTKFSGEDEEKKKQDN